MATVEQIRKRCPYLTVEHAEALLGFTEKRFVRSEGTLVLAFRRQPQKESEANPFIIDVFFENNEKVEDSRSITTPELILLADSLLKKDPS